MATRAAPTDSVGARKESGHGQCPRQNSGGKKNGAATGGGRGGRSESPLLLLATGLLSLQMCEYSVPFQGQVVAALGGERRRLRVVAGGEEGQCRLCVPLSGCGVSFFCFGAEDSSGDQRLCWERAKVCLTCHGHLTAF